MHAQVSKTRVKQLLANMPLFGDMSGADLDRIAAGTSELHVLRGETVFHRGDPCTGFHVVVYGQVKLAFTSPSGSEKVVEIIGPGFSFGEAVMFMETPYILTAEALADSMLLHVSRTVVVDGLARDAAFARKMLGGLSRRLHGLVSDVEAYSLRSGAQRVVGYLLRMEDEADVKKTCYGVTLPTAKAVLASRLNLTPEHFSRILHELTELGLIAVNGRVISILDSDRLREYRG